MGLLRLAALAAVSGLFPANVNALDWSASVDARLVLANATRSYLDGGLGKFRYNDGTTARLGRVRLAVEQRFGETLRLSVDASSWGDRDQHPFDLTSAFVEYRSYPHNAWRRRLRIGAFYPPSSLENRAAGWTTPYSINPSALNAWIGEEIRTIGLEASLDYLGKQQGSSLDWGLFAGWFGWNDPAGVLIATHGFALDDRQTTLNGRVGVDGVVPVSNRRLFYEIDHRAGYYAGASAKYLDRLEARVMHYDNRADATIAKPSIHDYAWMTSFDTAGVRYDMPRELTLLAQWLGGGTEVAPFGALLHWRFNTWNVMANQRWGAQAVSLRYDNFAVKQTINAFGPADQRDRGRAWTLAYAYERGDSPWRFMAEATRVDSFATKRLQLLNRPPRAIESKLELSLRYALSGHWH